MKNNEQTKRVAAVKAVGSFFTFMIAGWLTWAVFSEAMGCGWSGSCSDYGFVALITLLVLTLLSFIYFLISIFKLFKTD
jgi:hypothetical protein